MELSEEEYGIIVSQLGFDALEASDQDLILSNQFPMLKIDKQFTTAPMTFVQGDFADRLLFTHNYGYPCFFLLYVQASNHLINDFILYPTVDSEKIYLKSANMSGTFTFRVVTFRNPLNRALKTSVFRTQSREAALRNRDYGLIVSKDGFDTDSTDMRNFTFHSDTRNLLIHQVDWRAFATNYPTGDPANPISTGNGMYWANDLPYRPTFYAFTSLDSGNSFRLLFGGEQSVPGVRQMTDGSVRMDGFNAGDGTVQYGSLWVFKDPIDPGATKQVTI